MAKRTSGFDPSTLRFVVVLRSVVTWPSFPVRVSRVRVLCAQRVCTTPRPPPSPKARIFAYAVWATPGGRTLLPAYSPNLVKGALSEFRPEGLLGSSHRLAMPTHPQR